MSILSIVKLYIIYKEIFSFIINAIIFDYVFVDCLRTSSSAVGTDVVFLPLQTWTTGVKGRFILGWSVGRASAAFVIKAKNALRRS